MFSAFKSSAIILRGQTGIAPPLTMEEGSYIAQIHSFTKGTDYSAVVSKKHLDTNDRVFIR